MAYTGKPSRGCETCRKVHVKCDEKRPHCSRCVRLKKVCNGYRHEANLIVRMENGNPDSKSTWNGRRRKLERCSPPSCRGVHSHDLPKAPGAKSPRNLLFGVAQSLFPPQDDQKLSYFYEFMIGTMPESDHSRYLHLQLPVLFSRSRRDSALHLAARAISHAVWARSRGNHAHTKHAARKLYVQSISALKAALRDPIEVKSDESLYAILLLCGYETITLDLEMPSAWGSHVNGAAALLRVRGREQLCTPLQCNMFLFIRRNAVHSHIQLSRPVNPIFDELADAVFLFENTEDRLLSRMIKVPKLQSLANDILSQPDWSITESEVSGLIRAAGNLERELLGWASNVPAGWSYSVANNLVSMHSPGLSSYCYIPSEIHGYADFYIARVWNLYRVSRLIIQSILLRASSRLCSPLKSGGRQSGTTHMGEINAILVNEICASVPFLLGFDLSQLKRPTANINSQDNTMWPQSSISKVDNSQHTGRFSLIWPLYISCSVSTIPGPQRLWIRAQLQWIAEHGEPQAKLVSSAQSQTLLGGPEDFRFDCV